MRDFLNSGAIPAQEGGGQAIKIQPPQLRFKCLQSVHFATAVRLELAEFSLQRSASFSCWEPHATTIWWGPWTIPCASRPWIPLVRYVPFWGAGRIGGD